MAIRALFLGSSVSRLKCNRLAEEYVSKNGTRIIGHTDRGLMNMKPFRIGDFVQVGGVTGVVVALLMSCTRIWTIKNEEVTVPNHLYPRSRRKRNPGHHRFHSSYLERFY